MKGTNMSEVDQAIASLPYVELSQRMPAAAEALMERCLEYADGEQLYGLAFCPNDDVTSFYWMANTIEGIERGAMESYTRTMARFPETTMTLEHVSNEYRFHPPDWCLSHELFWNLGGAYKEATRICQDVNDPLQEIWDQFEALSLPEDEMFTQFDNVQKRCLDAMVEGLKQFDSDFDWSPVGGRDQFLLLVFIPDGNPRLVRDMARRLNPLPVWEQFAASYYSSLSTDE